jgi:hypothetical protein
LLHQKFSLRSSLFQYLFKSRGYHESKVPASTFSKPLADFPSESRTLQWPNHCLPVLIGGAKNSQAVEGLPVTGSDQVSVGCKHADSRVGFQETG